MPDDFYRAFEDKFRGSRELIKSRLCAYLPFIQPVNQFWPSAYAIDLGCGRGEWLELLGENGFNPIGVDLDDGMLSACREHQLKAYAGDALEYLANLPAESQAVVSGFHIAEHLPFELLQKIVKDALRVLKPGGLLILETPNPENLITGASDFYLDPTHQRPIPPQLLNFLTEFSGFKRSKIVRLNGPLALTNETPLTLLNVLNGVSPDYAVIAQKEGPKELFEALQPAFDVEYGLTLGTLATGYQEQVEAKAEEAKTKAQEAEAKAEEAKTKAQEAEATSRQCFAELHTVYASKSWRITAPLRWSNFQLMRLRQDGIKARAKAFVKKGLRKINHELILHPVMRQRIVRWSKKLGLHPWAKRLLAKVQGQYMPGGISGICSSQCVPENAQNLSPRARQIYADLKRAIEKNQKR